MKKVAVYKQQTVLKKNTISKCVEAQICRKNNNS